MSHDFLDNVKKNQARIAANIHGSYNIPTQINKSEEGETTKEERQSSEENKQDENLEDNKD